MAQFVELHVLVSDVTFYNSILKFSGIIYQGISFGLVKQTTKIFIMIGYCNQENQTTF